LGEFAEWEGIMKIKVVMIGYVVGDALGLPVEFAPVRSCRRSL